MAVKIRLARAGKKNAPIYRIVAIDSQRKRDGQALEILGTYNPASGEFVQFHGERIDEWATKGAILSDAVKKLQKQYRRSASASEQQSVSAS